MGKGYIIGQIAAGSATSIPANSPKSCLDRDCLSIEMALLISPHLVI